jgi:hypothetical protein
MSDKPYFPSVEWYRREIDRVMAMAEAAVAQTRRALDERDAAIREARAQALLDAADACDPLRGFAEQNTIRWLRARAAKERAR